MSVSIDLSRHSGGWRLTPEPQIDLSRWELDYRSDRIVCTPEPSDFVMMLLGTLVLYGFAIVFLLVAVAPGWLGFSAPQRPRASSGASEGKSLAAPSEPVLSPEEARRIQEDMLQQATKNMSPEKREKFLREVEEKIRQSREQAAAAARQGKPLFEWLAFAARLFALLPAALFALPGTLCLRRALMFFRDRVELSVQQGALVVQRPTLFGGESSRTWPLHEIEGIAGYCRKSRGYKWLVSVTGTNSRQPFLTFLVEETRDRSPEPQRFLDFADALARLTGTSLVQSSA
ncbi:MAG: hypothetical protein ACK53V_23760 [Planctomycetota bacterium]